MEDAGLAYFVVRQSVFVAVGLWLLLTLTSLGDDRAGRICKHGFMLFVVLCLPISNALLSIKTAAFMWAVYGFCYGQARRRAVPAGSGPGATTGDQSPAMDGPITIAARGWASGHG